MDNPNLLPNKPAQQLYRNRYISVPNEEAGQLSWEIYLDDRITDIIMGTWGNFIHGNAVLRENHLFPRY